MTLRPFGQKPKCLLDSFQLPDDGLEDRNGAIRLPTEPQWFPRLSTAAGKPPAVTIPTMALAVFTESPNSIPPWAAIHSSETAAPTPPIVEKTEI